MTPEQYILALTAAGIGFFHTLTGPDHYLPFVVIAKARKWEMYKTLSVVFVCGLLHVGSSIIIGAIGLALGIALNNLETIEAYRGDIAAWLILLFGAAYTFWGIRRINKPHHHHLHEHEVVDNTVKTTYKQLTPWILMTIFVFGPCEPLIPLLMYPAASHSISTIVIVALVFSIATIGTMLVMVAGILRSTKFIEFKGLEKYSHAIAGFTILLCGAAILFLGL